MSDEGLRQLLDGKSLAVLVLNFSPYHVARLRYMAAALAKWNARLHGIELAAVDTQYPWKVDRQREVFEWHTLVNDRAMGDVPHREQAAAIRRLLSELAPAAVVIPGWSHGFLRGAIRWCKARRVINVVQSDSIRGLPIRIPGEPARRWYLEFAKRLFLRGVDAAQGAGERSREYLAELGVPRARTVLKLDVVDNAYFAQISQEVRANPEPHRRELGLPHRFFLYPSRCMERKNQGRLLDAYTLYLRAAGPEPWSLLLLGSGPTESVIDARIAELQTPQITRRPYAAMPELARCYALAGALVFPSWNETWGLIVNEAAAAGLPLLVSKNAPACEHLLVEGKNGWSFNPLNVEEIAAGLMRMAALTQDERDAMARLGQTLVADWDLKDHTEEIFKALAIGIEHRRRG